MKNGIDLSEPLFHIKGPMKELCGKCAIRETANEFVECSNQYGIQVFVDDWSRQTMEAQTKLNNASTKLKETVERKR